MLKRINILTLFVFVFFNSCSDTNNFNSDEIASIIQKIEYSVNENNLANFQNNSNVHTFYNFNSILCKYVKSKNNKLVFTIKPSAYSTDDEYIKVEVLLNYSVNLKIKSINIDIPPELMQSIVNYGLPDKAYFYFSQRKNRYFLTEVDYPFRYKYMDLLKKFM